MSRLLKIGLLTVVLGLILTYFLFKEKAGSSSEEDPQVRVNQDTLPDSNAHNPIHNEVVEPNDFYYFDEEDLNEYGIPDPV